MCNSINKWTVFVFSLVVLAWMQSAVQAGTADDDAEDSLSLTQPKYEAKGRRDPFVQPRAGRLHNVMEKVDIESLYLTGVIRNPKQAMALFATRTGPKFGYLLKGDKLYRENHKPVQGITGKVISPRKVVLKQEDKKIVFELRPDLF
jgi:ABC-type cobalt transport system substrate-binding protein